MKQNISKKDWDELSGDQMATYRKFQLNDAYTELGQYADCLPFIGQMIEFLGDDLANISNELGNWFVLLFEKPIKSFESDELVDALFLAVKHKLNV